MTIDRSHQKRRIRSMKKLSTFVVMVFLIAGCATPKQAVSETSTLEPWQLMSHEELKVVAQKEMEETLYVGMSMEAFTQYIRSKPDRVNVSVGSWGRHEQWVYSNLIYLYFENGKLGSWQMTR